MAAVKLYIGMYWDPDLRDYFQHCVNLQYLIPDNHDYLFQFIDFDLYQAETPLAQYLSCLNDDSCESLVKPDKKFLRSAGIALQKMHPYFKTSPVNTAYMLNRIFAGYILRHFPDLDEARQMDMFRKVSLKKYDDYADPDQCFEHSIFVGSERVLDCLFTLQQKLRRWIFVTLDDGNSFLASFSTKRRSALYSIIMPSYGEGDDPLLKIQAHFAQKPSQKMAEKIRKWERELLVDIFSDLDDDAHADKKNSSGKVDMIEKIAQSIDELYINPDASVPGAVKEAIRLTSDVDDYDVITYDIENFSDLLELEVYRMITEGLHIRRCVNCHQYFIPISPDQKGCKRIIVGSTMTCEEIVKSKQKEKSKAKAPTHSKSPQEMYRTTYKTLSAKVKKGSMTQEAFNQWKREGLAKKALVDIGQLDIEEFGQWLKS